MGGEPALQEFSLLCTDVLDKIEIVEQDISDVISTLQINKAIGPDDISHKMLKETIYSQGLNTFVFFVQQIFNRMYISRTTEECKCTSII